MNAMLEKYMMKMAGGAGKGMGYAKGAAEHVAKKHPMAAGAALGAGAMGLAEHEEPDGDEEEMHLLKKLGLG